MSEPIHKRFFHQIEDGEARPLNKKDRFAFKCTCCGVCCHDNQILLKSYDIFRLTRSLGLTTKEFLARHCVRYVGKDSGLPLVMLKFLEDEKGACPFLEGRKCAVHEDRPSVCRLYPLGTMGQRGEAAKFYLQPASCPGHGRGKPQTLRSWLKASGLHDYMPENERFFKLITSVVKTGILKSESPTLLMIMGELLYNFDTLVPEVAKRRKLPVPTEWPQIFDIIEREVLHIAEGLKGVLDKLEKKDAA